MDKIMLALFALIGGFIGAVASHFLTKRREDEARQQKLKLETYVDYLHGIAGANMGVPQKTPDELKREEYELNRAIMRIVICGSTEVVRHLVHLKRGPSTEERESALVELCQAMRRDLRYRDERIEDKDIRAVLFRE